MNTTTIPSYEFYRGDSLEMPLKFIVLDTAEDSADGYNASEPHRHNYHEVFYFVRGGGWHDIDFRRFEIEDHAIHFVNPGQVHLIRRNPDSHGFIILFTTEFYLLNLREHDIYSSMWFLTHGSARPVVTPGLAERSVFTETMRMMADEYAGSGPHRGHLLHSYLHIFLLQSLRLFERSAGNGHLADGSHTLVNRLRTTIEERFTDVHSPSAYAEMLFVSQNHLNNTVKKVLGKTIGDLVHERIVLEAQRLLFHTDKSVKEIAFELNYDDPSYFTRFFRKHVGQAPHEFREATRKKHHASH